MPQDLRASLIAGATALSLASVLCADDLSRLAHRQPLGPARDLALSLVRPLHALSAALWLDRPARWVRPRLYPDALPPETPPAPVAHQSPEITALHATAAAPTESHAAAPAALLPSLRTPTPTRPLVLWAGGDSTAQRLGEELETLATSTGLMRASHDSQHATGLTRPDYFDWNTRFSLVLRHRHPDVMVVALGTNDAEQLPCPERPCPIETPAWTTAYRLRVDRAMTLLQGVPMVVWVTLPAMRSEGFGRKMAVINAAFRAEAARHANVVLLESNDYVTDHGAFTAYLPDARGRSVMVRETDGIHTTRDGARRVADAVMQLIETHTQR